MKKPADTSAELSELRKIPANKKCFDCNQAGTTYAAPELGVFLCSICGGIHREFSHRVKGLSTCNFSEAEVNKLKAAGNEKAALSWMARHDSRSFPIPDVKDSKKLKEFLRMKYLDKRFYENREVKVSENKTENKAEEKKVLKKPSGSINLLDDEPSSTLAPGGGGQGAVEVLNPSSSAGNVLNPSFNAFSNGFNAFNIPSNPAVPIQPVPNSFNIPNHPLVSTPSVPNGSSVPNGQNLFAFTQPGNNSAYFQPFANFPNVNQGTANPFPAFVPLPQPGPTSNLFAVPGSQGSPNLIENPSSPPVNTLSPGVPIASTGGSFNAVSIQNNGFAGNSSKQFDPFDFSSNSGSVQGSNPSQPSKDLFDAFNPFGNSASVSSNPAGVPGLTNNTSGLIGPSATSLGSNQNLALQTGNSFFGSQNPGNSNGFGLAGVSLPTSMNNANNGNSNHLAFNANPGGNVGSNFNPFGLAPNQNFNPQSVNFASTVPGFPTYPVNPAGTFEAFKVNPQPGPSHKFTSGQSHFSSKSGDPFEQIMEEQLERGLTSNSNNPFGNTPQNSLVQKYNQIVETYQRSYGMPFPYSFHEWKNMNSAPSAENEVKQARENPFDLYG